MHGPGNERLQPGGDLARFGPCNGEEPILGITLLDGSRTTTVESANGQPRIGTTGV